MNSTITLYYNCLVEKDKNFILDNNGVKAIETYLQTLTSNTIEDFQYIKQALSITIKIDASQIGLCMGDGCDDLNYCKIQNGNQNPCYYFIISKTWKSANTIELVLSMDTLNTYQYDEDYEVSPKTFVKRMHRDRFTKLSGQYSYSFTATNNENISFEFTSIDFAHSFPRNIRWIIYPNSVSSVTSSVITKNGAKYIRISLHTNATATYSCTIYYDVDALLSIIDLKSEEINVPVYKKQDTPIIETKGNKQIDWCLYYKTANNQETTPIDCYLVPSEAVTFYYQQASGEFNTGNVPEDKYLIFFVAYNDPPITFNINGSTYTPSRSYESYYHVTSFVAIAIFNDSGTIKVYKGSFNDYNGSHGSWTLIATNPTTLEVINSPQYVDSYEASSLPTASAIYNNQIYNEVYAQHTTNMGALVETTIYGDNTIDKTLSTNIKIINIPYSPTPFQVDSQNVFTFDDCWTYNSGDGKLKLTDFNKRFKNEVESAIPNLAENFVFSYYQHINLNEDVARSILDPKLKHSDYYRPKFVHLNLLIIQHLPRI